MLRRPVAIHKVSASRQLQSFLNLFPPPELHYHIHWNFVRCGSKGVAISLSRGIRVWLQASLECSAILSELPYKSANSDSKGHEHKCSVTAPHCTIMLREDARFQFK